MTWVVAYDGATHVEHLDGIPWHGAPKPRWWHRHWAQTRGWTAGSSFQMIERCPCGATHLDGHWFRERSLRRG